MNLCDIINIYGDFVMKDEKARYLIIDSTEINKQLYKATREAAFNDFYNVYEPNGMMDASQIFEKNGIPEEFRKVIVKINIYQLYQKWHVQI